MIEITEEGVDAFKHFLDDHTCDKNLLKKTELPKSLGPTSTIRWGDKARLFDVNGKTIEPPDCLTCGKPKTPFIKMYSYVFLCLNGCEDPAEEDVG